MTFKVSAEVESYCIACKTMKYHIILALMDGQPAKVECLGCHKQHAYKPTVPAPKEVAAAGAVAGEASVVANPKNPRAKKAAAAARPGVDLEAAFTEREARQYSPK